MNWIGRTKVGLVKILLVNLSVFASLWASVEVLNYYINPFSSESLRTTCYYDWISYGNCPEITDVNQNTPSDGGEVVFTYTNKIGQRIPRAEFEFVGGQVKHVFIGDSFIQADEMDFSETFYGILGETLPVIALGYSSWNIIQYADAIKKLGLRNTEYHVFLMPNDITPAYYRSVFRELQQPREKVTDIAQPTGTRAQLGRLYDLSLLKKLLEFLDKSQPDKNKIALVSGSGFISANSGNCDPLLELSDAQKGVLGYDYLVYSKKPICWSDKYIIAANLAVEELQKLDELVAGLDSKLSVYMIPPGWSFKNQNTNGRKNNGSYYFSDDVMVTTEPLTEYIKSKMVNLKLISLERVLMDVMSKCGNCQNEFYFPDDGHWTPRTHELLASYFAARLD